MLYLLLCVVAVYIFIIWMDSQGQPKVGTKQEENDRQRFLKMYDDWKEK